jgi:hypothetical protein
MRRVLVLIVVCLLTGTALLYPVERSGMSTLIGHAPGSPDPNWHHRIYRGGWPLPWLTLTHNWNEALGESRRNHRIEGWKLAVDLLVVAAVVTVLVGISRRFLWQFQRPPGSCAHCGYDLTGNVSGICPECGTPVPFKVSS